MANRDEQPPRLIHSGAERIGADRFGNIVDADGTPIGIQRSVMIFNNEQIKALPTTPVDIVANQGEGYWIKFVSGVLSLKSFLTGAYTNIDSTISAAFFSTGSGDVSTYAPTTGEGGSIKLDDILTSTLTSGVGVAFDPLQDALYTGYSVIENASLQFRFYNGSAGDLTGGHANNTLKLTTYYVVVEL